MNSQTATKSLRKIETDNKQNCIMSRQILIDMPTMTPTPKEHDIVAGIQYSNIRTDHSRKELFTVSTHALLAADVLGCDNTPKTFNQMKQNYNTSLISTTSSLGAILKQTSNRKLRSKSTALKKALGNANFVRQNLPQIKLEKVTCSCDDKTRGRKLSIGTDKDASVTKPPTLYRYSKYNIKGLEGLDLLRTCKWINAEATNFLYGENNFILKQSTTANPNSMKPVPLDILTDKKAWTTFRKTQLALSHSAIPQATTSKRPPPPKYFSNSSTQSKALLRFIHRSAGFAIEDPDPVDSDISLFAVPQTTDLALSWRLLENRELRLVLIDHLEEEGLMGSWECGRELISKDDCAEGIIMRDWSKSGESEKLSMIDRPTTGLGYNAVTVQESAKERGVIVSWAAPVEFASGELGECENMPRSLHNFPSSTLKLYLQTALAPIKR
ncbi:hypothetical protein BKA65DRAFT_480699 [Rhexocercosporidium sp. MPI-PUGE-AT-0058]|nr:hypothetical protein BKA65DRAFT_480699 [Rhexocercosporidium sp. MPI-PUGE-AT-0058]